MPLCLSIAKHQGTSTMTMGGANTASFEAKTSYGVILTATVTEFNELTQLTVPSTSW